MAQLGKPANNFFFFFDCLVENHKVFVGKGNLHTNIN